MIGLLALLTLSSGAFAGDNYYVTYDPCDPCMENNSCCPNIDFCNGDFDFKIYGDYLYWRTRRCELDYAIPTTGNSTSGPFVGNVYTVCPEYDSGFRVGGIVGSGDLYLEGRYTYYQSSSEDSVVDSTGNLIGTRIVDDFPGGASQGAFNFARADYSVHYHAVDALLGYDMDVGRCFDFHLFTGFKGLFIEQKFNVLYSDAEDIDGPANTYSSINDKIELDGYGLTLGFDMVYHVYDCIGLTGSFAYDVLAGNTDRHFSYRNTTDGGQNFTDNANLRDECWRTISGLNLAIGMQYETRICNCYDVVLGAGYEFHHYLNFSDFLALQSESGETTFDRQTDGIGFDGLYVRLGIGF